MHYAQKKKNTKIMHHAQKKTWINGFGNVSAQFMVYGRLIDSSLISEVSEDAEKRVQIELYHREN